MQADHRRFLRDVSLILGVPLAGMIALILWWRPWTTRYEVPAGSDIFAVVSGRWDWDADSACTRNVHTISFSPDHRVMTLRYDRPDADSTGERRQAWDYDILQVSRDHIRGRIRGEERMTAEGKPVVWDLILRSRDAYVWHRTDWPFMANTRAVRRCPAQ